MVDHVERFLEKKFAADPSLRQKISTLYRTYNGWGIKDSKFDKDFCDGRNDHFYPYLWEMLLAHHLTDLGFALSSNDAGPDFKTEYLAQTLWIEATCPSPKTNTHIPHNILRTTIKRKTEKLIGNPLQSGQEKPGYLAKGIVKDHDLFVIALNTSRLNQFIEMDIKGLVSLFHDSKYKHISAILLSSQDMKTLEGAPLPILVVHNPWAKNKLPHNILGADEEFSFIADKIF